MNSNPLLVNLSVYPDKIIGWTYDANNSRVDFTVDETSTVDAMIESARTALPAWQREKEELEALVSAQAAASEQDALLITQLSEMLYGEGTDTPIPEPTE